MLKHRWLIAMLAVAACCAVAAAAIAYRLPLPASSGTALATYVGYVYVFVLVGPVLFAWAAGPGPLTAGTLIAAVGIPVAILVALVLGLRRRRSPAWLGLAALLWGGFGGLAAFMAISGSI